MPRAHRVSPDLDVICAICRIVDKTPCLWAYTPSGIQTHDPSDYKLVSEYEPSVYIR